MNGQKTEHCFGYCFSFSQLFMCSGFIISSTLFVGDSAKLLFFNNLDKRKFSLGQIWGLNPRYKGQHRKIYGNSKNDGNKWCTLTSITD